MKTYQTPNAVIVKLQSSEDIALASGCHSCVLFSQVAQGCTEVSGPPNVWTPDTV